MVAVAVLAAAFVTPAAAGEEPGLPWDALREALAAEDGAEAADGAAGLDADGLADDVLRDAAAFREHPVDVNTAGVRDLLRVPFLEPGAALRIVAARVDAGPFAAVDDLVARGCLTAEACAVVRPYITAVAPPASAPPASAAPATTAEPARSDSAAAAPGPDAQWRSSVLSRTSLAAGGSSAPGGPGTFVRLRLARGSALTLGLACEKDQGEDSIADHVAFRAEWQVLGAGDGSGPAPPGGRGPGTQVGLRVGLGDLTVSWAQGLIAGSSGIVTAAGYPSRRDRLRGYDGAAEASSRRGVCAAVVRGPVAAQVVLARTRLDASIDDSGMVTSLRASGWHRTDGERSGRDALTEEITGARITLEPRAGLRVGLTAVRLQYDPPFAEGDPERQRFRFSGSALNLGGADAVIAGEKWQAGGEVAVTDGGAIAWLGAVKATVARATVAFGAARLARDYWSPVGGGAPGASGGTNGTGAWVRVRYRPGPGTEVWCEVAVSRRPWRSYLNELPDGRRSVSLCVERSLGAAGRASVTVRETLRSTEGGDPTRSVSGWSRLVRADWRSAGEPGFSASVIRSTALADSVAGASLAAGGRTVLGSSLVLALRTEMSLGDRMRLDAGVVGVSRLGDVPLVVQYEPRLSGEFGLVSLSASGVRWYARLRAGLRLGVGVTARVAGGPEQGRVDVGIGIEAGG